MITSEGLKAAVRPGITILFVVAQIALAFMWAIGIVNAEPAFAALTAFTMLIVKDYFDARKQTEIAAASSTTSTSTNIPIDDSNGIK